MGREVYLPTYISQGVIPAQCPPSTLSAGIIPVMGAGRGPAHTGYCAQGASEDVGSLLSNIDTWRPVDPLTISPKLGTEVVAHAGAYKPHSLFHLQPIAVGGYRKHRC